jgi:hypothetical protein
MSWLHRVAPQGLYNYRVLGGEPDCFMLTNNPARETARPALGFRASSQHERFPLQSSGPLAVSPAAWGSEYPGLGSHLASGIPRVDGALRLDKKNLGLLGGVGTVLDTTRHHEYLTGRGT